MTDKLSHRFVLVTGSFKALQSGLPCFGNPAKSMHFQSATNNLTEISLVRLGQCLGQKKPHLLGLLPSPPCPAWL
uniref:Uncharacterized protein n=1 Tax=Arundo donax TaxID=35708 RepID=A0A0A9AYT4_ARUDO